MYLEPWQKFMMEVINKYRSSYSQMFFKIAALKNFAIFTGKKQRWSFFNKALDLKASNFIKIRLQHRFFFLENCKNFKNSFPCRTTLVAVSGSS